MNKEKEATEQEIEQAEDSVESCSVGNCGGPGLCPGVALLVGYAAGTGLAYLTGMAWLGWLVGVPLVIILITGIWRQCLRYI